MAGPALSSPHWQHVVGQTRMRAQLADSLRANRAAHACLFSGPAGVGKTAVALEYAALLLCDRDGPVPCGQCPQCHATARLEHPDLHLIFPLPSTAKKAGEREAGTGNSTDEDPANLVAERLTLLIGKLAQDPYANLALPKLKRQKDDAKDKNENQIIRIAQVRALLRQASLKPFPAARKVFVLFNADTMNMDAQNAFLKVLEDPSPESYFILITDSEQELLPTIRSRCQKFAFAPLERGEIRDALVAGGIPADRAEAAAALSSGRLVRAREMASGNVAELQTHVISFVRAAAKCDPAMIQTAAANLLNTGSLPSETSLELLGLFLRDVALCRAGEEALTGYTFAGFESSIAGVLSTFPQADFETAAQAVDESAGYLTKGYTQDLVLYALAIKLHDALGTQASTKPKPQARHA